MRDKTRIGDLVELVDENGDRTMRGRGRVISIEGKSIKVRWPDGRESEVAPEQMRVYAPRMEV